MSDCPEWPIGGASGSKPAVTKEDEMRSDPYQERARALAIEAGLDPDSKIDRPWTTADADMVHVPRRRA